MSSHTLSDTHTTPGQEAGLWNPFHQWSTLYSAIIETLVFPAHRLGWGSGARTDPRLSMRGLFLLIYCFCKRNSYGYFFTKIFILAVSPFAKITMFH